MSDKSFRRIEQKKYRFPWQFATQALIAQTDIQEGHWELRLQAGQHLVMSGQLNNAGPHRPMVVQIMDGLELVRVRTPTGLSVDAARVFADSQGGDADAPTTVPGPAGAQ